jgi:hypothetical protein
MPGFGHPTKIHFAIGRCKKRLGLRTRRAAVCALQHRLSERFSDRFVFDAQEFGPILGFLLRLFAGVLGGFLLSAFFRRFSNAFCNFKKSLVYVGEMAGKNGARLGGQRLKLADVEVFLPVAGAHNNGDQDGLPVAVALQGGFEFRFFNVFGVDKIHAYKQQDQFCLLQLYFDGFVSGFAGQYFTVRPDLEQASFFKNRQLFFQALHHRVVFVGVANKCFDRILLRHAGFSFDGAKIG